MLSTVCILVVFMGYGFLAFPFSAFDSARYPFAAKSFQYYTIPLIN
jgi:hypothetical protein